MLDQINIAYHPNACGVFGELMYVESDRNWFPGSAYLQNIQKINKFGVGSHWKMPNMYSQASILILSVGIFPKCDKKVENKSSLLRMLSECFTQQTNKMPK